MTCAAISRDSRLPRLGKRQLAAPRVRSSSIVFAAIGVPCISRGSDFGPLWPTYRRTAHAAISARNVRRHGMKMVLGIETSCDETAAAVVGLEERGAGHILSNVVASQIADHAEYGGVVPEIAARAHVDLLDGVIERALDEAGTALAELDAIAVTAGPGLIGGLIVGTMTAKAMAAASGRPLIPVNHLEGHALTARLTDNLDFPYLLLLVSGGHSQILLVEGVGRYHRWATTIDDALGEAFDKTAKLLALPYPGGPNVERSRVRGACLPGLALTFPPGLSWHASGSIFLLRPSRPPAPDRDLAVAAEQIATWPDMSALYLPACGHPHARR